MLAKDKDEGQAEKDNVGAVAEVQGGKEDYNDIENGANVDGRSRGEALPLEHSSQPMTAILPQKQQFEEGYGAKPAAGGLTDDVDDPDQPLLIVRISGCGAVECVGHTSTASGIVSGVERDGITGSAVRDQPACGSVVAATGIPPTAAGAAAKGSTSFDGMTRVQADPSDDVFSLDPPWADSPSANYLARIPHTSARDLPAPDTPSATALGNVGGEEVASTARGSGVGSSSPAAARSRWMLSRQV